MTVRAPHVCVKHCNASVVHFVIWITVLLLALTHNMLLCLPLPRAPCPLPRGRGSGAEDNPGGKQSQATITANNPFLLHVAVQSVLQIDVEVEEPERSENLTQSFEIYNIIWRRPQLLALIIYILYII